MAKRGASFNSSSDSNPKLARSDTTTLADVSTGVTGIYTLNKPVRIEGLHWRAACYNGCSTCRRKVDRTCSFHPSIPSEAYYRMRVLIKQGDVQLWLTAFDEIAVDILGTPASKFDSLDESGRIKLVDSVVGLKLLVNIVKSVKNGYVNFVFAKIYAARTNFPATIIDSTKTGRTFNGREHHHRPHRSRLRLYHRSWIHRHHLIHTPLPMTTPTMTRST